MASDCTELHEKAPRKRFLQRIYFPGHLASSSGSTLKVPHPHIQSAGRSGLSITLLNDQHRCNLRLFQGHEQHIYCALLCCHRLVALLFQRIRPTACSSSGPGADRRFRQSHRPSLARSCRGLHRLLDLAFI